MALEKFETLDLGVMQRAFEVNTLGPLRISKALVPLLASPGGKILIVSTLMGSISDAGGRGLHSSTFQLNLSSC
jgi:tubulin alpha